MRIPKLFVSSLVLALSTPAISRAETKIGVIDSDSALDQLEDGKAYKATLTKEGDERQAKLQAKKAELDKANAEYEKQVAVLSDQAKKEKELDLQRRVMELQQLADTMQREMLLKRDELLGPIQARMTAVVKEVADAEGLGIILRTEAAFYAIPSLDITNEVVRKYNTRFPRKAGAGAPAADPKAKPASDPKPKPASDKPAPKPKP